MNSPDVLQLYTFCISTLSYLSFDDWSIDWSIDRLIDWSIDWSIDLLIDGGAYTFYVVVFIYFCNLFSTFCFSKLFIERR